MHRQLTDVDIARITNTYHRWRGDGKGKYEDVAGFCKSATTEEIRAHQHLLTPGRYVGAEDVEEDEEPHERKSVRAKLRVIVKRILRKYGYPPDKQEAATNTVLQQAELLSDYWTNGVTAT